MLTWLRTGTNDIEERLRHLEAGQSAAVREELHALDLRIRSLEDTAVTMMSHVATCERLGMQAARDRAALKRELRGFAFAILLAIMGTFLGALGVHSTMP